MKIEINPNLDFCEVVECLEALKFQYEEILTSFLYIHERNKFIEETRNMVYSLKFPEWKRDKIWEYLNGFEYLYVMRRIK